VRFELAPSPVLAATVVAAHAAAGAAAWLALPGAAGAAAACALLALGAAAAWSRALLRSRASLRAIEIDAAHSAFELADGTRLIAPAHGRRYVTRGVIAVPLGGPLGRTALVTADMLRPGEFRRLRIWALWNRLPPDRRKELIHSPRVYVP
jgi:hypothetical protein